MAKVSYVVDDFSVEDDEADEEGAAKVASADLRDAGLELMRQNGMGLEKTASNGRSQIYRTAEGETVRIRTCNKHIFIAGAEGNDLKSRLNIEGTDSILYIMPQVELTPGPVWAYLIPTVNAVRAVLQAHAASRRDAPKGKQGNRTRNVWFGGDKDLPLEGFYWKWEEHRLEGEASTLIADEDESDKQEEEAMTLKDAIHEARAMIARVAKVDPMSVRIQIDL